MTEYHDQFWAPDDLERPSDEFYWWHDLIDWTDDDTWNVKQFYGRDKPTERAVCSRCGGEQFIVGLQDCHTTIRCPVCRWELCIHEG